MNKILMIIIHVFISFNCLLGNILAQDALKLTKKEIEDDFNFLCDSVIKEVYAKQAVGDFTNTGFCKELLSIKEEIESISSDEEFTFLIQKALNSTTDAHSGICNGSDIKYLLECLPEEEKKGLLRNIDTSMLVVSNKRNEQYWNYLIKAASKFKFYIFSRYLNGEYYNLIPIKKEGRIIEIGSKIVKINDINIHDWVNNHILDYRDVSYDIDNERYYVDLFFTGISFFKDRTNVDLTFESPSGEISKETFDLSSRPKFKRQPWLSINLTKVKYFKKDKVLYIRLGSMSSVEDYLQKIAKYGAKKTINRIIVDVRQNGGGSDLVWKRIVEELIDEPLNLDLTVGVKDNFRIRNYYGNGMLKEKFNFKNDTFAIVDSKELESFIPSETSLRFSKKIIIIQDKHIFSSAASFTSVGSYVDKFITLGSDVDKPIGVGLTPMYFMLPNSKVLIRIDPTIDFTKATDYENLFQKVNIEVDESIDSKYKWIKKNGNRWNRAFLYKNDPYYQKALEIDIE